MKTKVILTLVIILALGAFLSACSTQSTPAADTSSSSESSSVSIDAKALVDTKCTTCHTLDKLSGEKRDETGWVKVVDKMDKKGNIGFTSDEKSAVAAYLAETYK